MSSRLSKVLRWGFSWCLLVQPHPRTIGLIKFRRTCRTTRAVRNVRRGDAKTAAQAPRPGAQTTIFGLNHGCNVFHRHFNEAPFLEDTLSRSTQAPSSQRLCDRGRHPREVTTTKPWNVEHVRFVQGRHCQDMHGQFRSTHHDHQELRNSHWRRLVLTVWQTTSLKMLALCLNFTCGDFKDRANTFCQEMYSVLCEVSGRFGAVKGETKLPDKHWQHALLIGQKIETLRQTSFVKPSALCFASCVISLTSLCLRHRNGSSTFQNHVMPRSNKKP